MTRFHELDALRAFAMFLGVVLHASLFLVDKNWAVAAKEVSPALPYDDIVLAIHGFRMPIFFLLSGFFTALLWQRRGVQALIKHRMQRVGIPLLIGAFTIVPLQVYWWLLKYDPDFNRSDFIWVIPFSWLESVHHLWFLWVLLLLVGIFAILTRVGTKLTDRRFWWILIPLVLVPQLMMVEKTWGPDTSATIFVNPIVVAYYLCFFLFGAFMYQAKLAIDNRWVIALTPVLPVFYIGLSLEFASDASWAEPASSVLQVGYAWALCFGTMGLFKIIASENRGWVRYLSDASYWIYLWHLVLIFPAQALAAGLDLNIHLEVLAIIVGVTAVLLVIYHFGVRYTIIGTLLNGPRTRSSGSGVDQSGPPSSAGTDPNPRVESAPT